MFDDFMPAAFAMALYNDGLAMNRFTDLSEAEKEEILNRHGTAVPMRKSR